jgi:ElaB/YqjD/DUF883 family membrane-anchored ribosome-binding protein
MINGTFAMPGHLSGQSVSPNHGVEHMSSASTASQNIRDAANDTVREAREGMRDASHAASDASGKLQDDLLALRDDLTKLAGEMREVLSARGNAAWQRARSGLEDAGRDAADAAREVSDNFVGVVDESLKERPYTTLAIVAGIAFLFGLTWRR